MQKKKTGSLSKSLTRYLVWPVLMVWLLAMLLLTWAVARDLYRQLESNSFVWIQSAAVDHEDLPGRQEYQRLFHIAQAYGLLKTEPMLPIVLPNPGGRYNWQNQAFYSGFEVAAAYYDDQNKPLFVSDKDYLYFSYSNTPDGDIQGYAYIDMSQLYGEENAAEQVSGVFLSPVRLTGYLEGNRFHLFRYESSGLDLTIRTAAEDQELITIYGLNGHTHKHSSSQGFRYQGKNYESPDQLLKEPDLESRYDLFSSIIIHRQTTADGTVALAIHCRPAQYALVRLLPVYLITFSVVLHVVICIRRKIRRNLLEPLAVIDRAYDCNRAELSDFAHSPWEEVQALGEHFNGAQQDRHQAKNDVQQLRTALDYAKNAEENRRKMTAAIAHELKTPLAVIHSYAEGLQVGIAKEKQDKYLSVILEETEHLDEMVLEMLELSRLEAGKVRLSTDRFSILALTQEILGKLDLAVQAKQLQITVESESDFRITADRERIGQVISNFVTNAIKYTQPGGLIRIRVWHRNGLEAHFAIENQSAPLPEETLSQVWDAFYRADTARTGNGTGLGLSVAKSIIELHRGNCQVRNTKTGVEFQFSVPM